MAKQGVGDKQGKAAPRQFKYLVTRRHEINAMILTIMQDSGWQLARKYKKRAEP